jgi:hypothetical protein
MNNGQLFACIIETCLILTTVIDEKTTILEAAL